LSTVAAQDAHGRGVDADNMERPGVPSTGPERPPWLSSLVPPGRQPAAVDLFCGAGGASLGLLKAGFDLRLGVDIDPTYGMTHNANLVGRFMSADLRQLDANKISQAAEVAPGELDLLFAGPPCQGFSMMGARVVWDERHNLFRVVLRVGAGLRPRAVVIENVPGLLTLGGGAYLRAILQGLAAAGYVASCAELLAAQYGAPQMRWRLVVIAWRVDLASRPAMASHHRRTATGALATSSPTAP
jgi:DNA (cytosine-5)-methyltransferase 1